MLWPKHIHHSEVISSRPHCERTQELRNNFHETPPSKTHLKCNFASIWISFIKMTACATADGLNIFSPVLTYTIHSTLCWMYSRPIRNAKEIGVGNENVIPLVDSTLPKKMIQHKIWNKRKNAIRRINNSMENSHVHFSLVRSRPSSAFLVSSISDTFFLFVLPFSSVVRISWKFDPENLISCGGKVLIEFYICR